MQDGTEDMSEGDENMTGNWLTQPDAESPSGSQASNPIETSKIMADENDEKMIVESTIIRTGRLSPDFQDAPETADTPDTGLFTQEETESITPRRARKALQFSDNDDDNDQADNQSVGSSESGSSLSSQESIMLTLLERRLQNDERNSKFLSYLDSKYERVVLKAKPKGTDKEVDEKGVEEDSPQKELGPPRGMLIKMNTGIDLQTKDSTLTTTNAAKSLQTRYPHRESQIRLLTSLLSATMSQTSRYSPRSNISTYVPAPIFVTGPSGTGKTAICRDVVGALDKTASGVASAYVNCAILEPSSIDRLVSSAFTQLKPIELEEIQNPRRRKRKHKYASTEDVPAKVQAVSNAEDAVNGDSQENDKQTTTTEEREGLNVEESAEPGAADAAIETEVPNQDEEKGEQDADINKRIQPGRRAKADNIPTVSAMVAGKGNAKKIGSIVAKSNTAAEKVEASSWANHAAVAGLGRALKPYYGRESKGCAFLVLDHAERLLSLSMKKAGNELTNYLAELLLLPKVMELNLTIIVITNNCVLDSSRLNNIVAAGKSHATLLNGVHPYQVKFTAYKGIDVFKKILRVPGVLRLIVGDDTEDASASVFQDKVKESFLNTLVQSLSGSTRDIREFIRLGRSFWPFYIKPLHPFCIEKTMESIDKYTSSSADSEVVEKAILAYLDEKIFPHISGFLNDGLFSLSLDSPMVIDSNANTKAKKDADNDQPYLRTCLLLAAFICQNNKATQDKRIFSIKGTGKRRGRNRVHAGASEDVAFGSTLSEQQQLNMIRPRPFLLERMLSIFVTLVGLNPAREDLLIDTGDRDDFLQSLGSTFLYTSLAQLRDIGHLHEAGFTGSSKTEQINLSSTKYWCSLTRDEAMGLAKKVDIPLATYLL